jgi:hypothetical protein
VQTQRMNFSNNPLVGAVKIQHIGSIFPSTMPANVVEIQHGEMSLQSTPVWFAF